ncbi:putative ribonuclease H-like domain-containing protein [Tanacetum coccineum]
MHAVPPPMTGIYIPPKSDFGIDESNFTYGPKQSKTSESTANISDSVSCESNSSVETLESVPKPAVNELKVEKPSFAFVNTVKHVKTPRETVKEQHTYSPSPKADKRDQNGLMSKKLGLGYGFTKKACFVCGSFSHLIIGQRENRLVWNNVQRLNHQNKFVLKAILTKTGIFPVNVARQNLSSQAAATSTARKVNTARPIVNEIRLRNNFYKSYSTIRRPSNRTTSPKTNFANHKVNTVGDKTVSTIGAIGKLLLRPQQVVIGDPKDITRTKHMTGNKAYLVENQDYNGGAIAFGGSKGQINSKDSDCLILSPDFKLPDENQVLLRVPRKNNMYSFNLENIVPTRGLSCLISKATVDESNKWHKRMGHVNFKNLNKLVKGNLVRG